MSAAAPVGPKGPPSTNNPLEEDEDFECSVCHEVFKDVVMTSCGHSFCDACIKDWQKSKKVEEYSCPNCRKPLPKNNDIQPNYLVRKLIEKLKKVAQAPLAPLKKLAEMQKNAQNVESPKAPPEIPAAAMAKQPPVAVAPAQIKPAALVKTSKEQTLQKIKKFIDNFPKEDYQAFKRELSLCMDKHLAHQIMIAYDLGAGRIESALTHANENRSQVLSLLEGHGIISRSDKDKWQKFIKTVEQIPEFSKEASGRLEALITCVQRYLKAFGKDDYHLFQLRCMSLIDRELAKQLACAYGIGGGQIDVSRLPEIELGERIIHHLVGRLNKDLEGFHCYFADNEISLTAFVSKLEAIQKQQVQGL